MLPHELTTSLSRDIAQNCVTLRNPGGVCTKTDILCTTLANSLKEEESSFSLLMFFLVYEVFFFQTKEVT